MFGSSASAETILVVRIGVELQGLLIQDLSHIWALLQNHNLKSGFGEQPGNRSTTTAAPDDNKVSRHHVSS
jgi:hypothetical protein